MYQKSTLGSYGQKMYILGNNLDGLVLITVFKEGMLTFSRCHTRESNKSISNNALKLYQCQKIKSLVRTTNHIFIPFVQLTI